MGIVLRVTSGPHTGQEYWSTAATRSRSGGRRASTSRWPYDLVLSREHFQIENEPPLCHLVDLGSTNGTKVNGLRVGRVLLREGDVITAGDSSFMVHFVEDLGDGANFATCAGCGGRIPIGQTRQRSGDRRSLAPSSGPRRLAVRRLRGPPAQVPRDPSRLLDRGMDRRRGHGRGLSRPAALAQPAGRHQDDQRQQRGRRQGQRLFPSRNRGPARPADARRPVPSQHRRLLRDLRGRLPVSTGHGVRRRQERTRLDQGAGAAAADRQRPPRSAVTCCRRSTTLIPRDTCTATSSRPTCW